MADRRTVRVRISGRVQGVWYRAWTRTKATELGLSGWVRNRPDGTVEAVFSGTGEAVAAMVAACHDGPPAARVANVETSAAEPPDRDGFVTLPSG